jgi:hypothetical protein
MLSVALDDAEASATCDAKLTQQVTSHAVDTGGSQELVAPDVFDEKYRTTKWEIWAYYAWVRTNILINR